MAPPACRAAPAPPGFRDAESNRGYGALRNVGNLGYIWSSSILSRSGYAHYLSFNYAGIGPQSYNHRAYGFQLRCLQEEDDGAKPASRRQRGKQRAPTKFRAPHGVAEARALLRSADFLLAAQFSGARPIENHFRHHSAPPNGLCPRALAIHSISPSAK